MLTAFITPCTAGSGTNISINEHTDDIKIPKLRIIIVFGKDKPTCHGPFNICYIILFGREYAPADYEAAGTLDVGEYGQSLIFETKKYTGFTDVTGSECFANGRFLMTADFIIPNEIIDKSGFIGNPVISAGSYPVEDRGDSIVIVFNK
jgi:hypothetical protein